MAGIKAVIIGRGALNAHLTRIARAQTAGMTKALLFSAEDIRTEAIREIQGGPARTGQIYKRGKKSHQASAPGEPPKTDTGFLVGSIFSVVSNSKTRPVAFVGTTIKYGAFLEFGTKRMRPRPWLHPAFELALPRIIKRVEKAHRAANKTK